MDASDGSDTRGTRLRAWSGITGWRFESSSAHLESPAYAGLSSVLAMAGRSELAPANARGPRLGNARAAVTAESNAAMRPESVLVRRSAHGQFAQAGVRRARAGDLQAHVARLGRRLQVARRVDTALRPRCAIRGCQDAAGRPLGVTPGRHDSRDLGHRAEVDRQAARARRRRPNGRAAAVDRRLGVQPGSSELALAGRQRARLSVGVRSGRRRRGASRLRGSPSRPRGTRRERAPPRRVTVVVSAPIAMSKVRPCHCAP